MDFGVREVYVLRPKKILSEGKYGIILPRTKSSSGSSDDEFLKIRAQLRSRNIVWHEREVGATTIVWMHGTEVSKLPKNLAKLHPDNGYSYYIPTDNDNGCGVLFLDPLLDQNQIKDVCCPS